MTTFEISKTEERAVNKIKRALEVLFGVNKAEIEYRFVPTGIGTVVSIYCPQIKQEYDVTDYGSW